MTIRARAGAAAAAAAETFSVSGRDTRSALEEIDTSQTVFASALITKCRP